MKVRSSLLALVVWAGASLPGTSMAEQYMTQEAFVANAFAGNTPGVQMLWLNPDHKAAIRAILGHDYNGLRIRYWRDGLRTTWIIDEIGKELPITIGVIVDNNKIHQVKILAFRESRGWEVRHTFFTDQFNGAQAREDHQLDRSIDGITGATLSVRAVVKVARMALYLHSKVVAT